MIAFSIQEMRADEFSYRLGNLSQLVRKGLVDPEIGTLSKQSQLLTERCMQLTPPKNVAQGKRRVQLDIEKIFHPVKESEITTPSIKRIVRLGDAQAWDSFARYVKGPFAGTTAIEPTRELHRANRDKRGRARKTRFVTLAPQQKTMRELIIAKQKNVGWARAGWMRGYTQLGGTRAPEWVKRHGLGQGSVLDARFQPDRPFVQVMNLTAWAGRGEESQRIVTSALQSRARAMQSYFEKMMELASHGTPTAFQTQQAAIGSQFFGEEAA